MTKKEKKTILSKHTKKASFDNDWDELKTLLITRKHIWDKLSEDKRQEWLIQVKDPVIASAHEMYRVLYAFFGGV